MEGGEVGKMLLGAVGYKFVRQAQPLYTKPVKAVMICQKFQHRRRKTTCHGIFLKQKQLAVGFGNVYKLFCIQRLDKAGIKHGHGFTCFALHIVCHG